MAAYVPVSEALPQPPRQTGLCFSLACAFHILELGSPTQAHWGCLPRRRQARGNNNKLDWSNWRSLQSLSSNVHRSFDLFHIGGLIRNTVNLLPGCEVVVIFQALITIINAEAHIDHAVDEACELRWLVQLEF